MAKLNKNDYDEEEKSQKFLLVKKRTILKNSLKDISNYKLGKIVTSFGSSYLVQELILSELNQKLISHTNSKKYAIKDDTIYECILSGTLVSRNKKSTILAVGDIVYFEQEKQINSSKDIYRIVQVFDRHSWLSRKDVLSPNEHIIAANVDKLLIQMSAAEPMYNRRLIDRYLVAAEQGEIEPAICINKIDLLDCKELRQDFQVYEKMEIPVFFISAMNQSGLEPIMKFIKDSVTVISGPSGVGKSTLINNIIGINTQIVQEISERTNKGRHTTSFVKLFTADNGIQIIDTPGIREFAVHGIKKEELALYFKDFEDFHLNCKFLPCTHTHEPGCAVKEAVENGLIDIDRYESYLNLYDSFD